LQEFKEVFPKEIPHGLPLSRGIEHQIDLLPGASLPNRPAYKSNPQETEEIHKQVKDLMQKGWVQESLSPCVVPVILMTMKDGQIEHKDAQAKVEYVKRLHEQVKAQIAKKNESYAKQANKNKKKVVLEPSDWVWVHMRKERFSKQRKSKLQPKRDGLFQVLVRINDNAYKNDIQGEYGVISSFNVADLSPFFAGGDSEDLRENAFQEGGNDENPKTAQI